MIVRNLPLQGAALFFILGLNLRPALADNCSFDVQPVDFGSINSILSDNETLTPQIKLTCNGRFGQRDVDYCLSVAPANAGDANAGINNHRVLWASLPGDKTAYLPFDFKTADNKSWGGGADDDGNVTYGTPIFGTVSLSGNGDTFTLPFTAEIGSGKGMQIAAGTYTNIFNVHLYYELHSDGSDPKQLCSGEELSAAETHQLTVKAKAQPACTVQVTQAIDFGANFRLDAVPPATGNIQVACGGGTKYTIGLSEGNNAENGHRAMKCDDSTKCNNAKVYYDLYQDLAHTELWGNDKDTVSGGFLYTDSGSRDHTVYAAITPGQNPVPPGSYKDTVIVTVWAEARFDN